MTKRRLLAIAAISGVLASMSHTLDAKEFNRRSDIAPDTNAVLQRNLAKSRIQKEQDPDDALIITDDVVNTGCGKLEIGRIDATGTGRIDRDIIITGNIINSARNCPRR